MTTKDRIGAGLAAVAAILGLVLVSGFRTAATTTMTTAPATPPAGQVVPATGQVAPAPGGQIQPAPGGQVEQPAAPQQVTPTGTTETGTTTETARRLPGQDASDQSWSAMAARSAGSSR